MTKQRKPRRWWLVLDANGAPRAAGFSRAAGRRCARSRRYSGQLGVYYPHSVVQVEEVLSKPRRKKR